MGDERDRERGESLRGPEAELATAFRQAMRGLAKGVVIVTARDDRGRHAMAATAMTPLTMSPPSLLICVNRSASIAPALQLGSAISVNVLASDHEALSAACSGSEKGEARFRIDAWAEGALGLPIVKDALATVAARIASLQVYGTHLIVVGEVVDCKGGGRIAPLIYFDGQYRELSQDMNA